MDDDGHTIFAAVLAAGSASRFGSAKQLAILDGKPLVAHATSAAQRVLGRRVVTVVGYEGAAVLATLGSDAGFVVVNEDFEAGMSGSISAACTACREDADAILVVLADQPAVTAEHLQALIDRWSGRSDAIVATAFAGTAGPPVLFPKDTFGDLENLSGDRGARSLLRDSRFSLAIVGFEDAGFDVDTPADLDALREKLLHTSDDL